MNLDAVFTSYPDFNSKWIMKLNIKTQNYKTSRKKTGDNMHDLRYGGVLCVCVCV